MSKVVILGAGFVGTATATYLADRNVADITMLDVVDYGLAAGKAVDLLAASAARGFSSRIRGTDKLEELADADVVVNTAGMARKPGMDRMDLLKKNAEIAQGLGKGIREHAPNAVVLNVANPLDVLCHVLLKETGFPRERVVGMAGVLDSSRFRTFIADELDCDPAQVSAMVMGGHGDTMVPITRTACVNGVPVSELIDESTLAAIVERTRKAGAEIVKLLRTGSAFSSTGACVSYMVEAFLAGRPRLLPASVRLEGEYGYSGIYLGVPALLGKGGLKKVVEMELTDAEKTALDNSAQEVTKGIQSLEGSA